MGHWALGAEAAGGICWIRNWVRRGGWDGLYGGSAWPGEVRAGLDCVTSQPLFSTSLLVPTSHPIFDWIGVFVTMINSFPSWIFLFGLHAHHHHLGNSGLPSQIMSLCKNFFHLHQSAHDDDSHDQDRDDDDVKMLNMYMTKGRRRARWTTKERPTQREPNKKGETNHPTNQLTWHKKCPKMCSELSEGISIEKTFFFVTLSSVFLRIIL